LFVESPPVGLLLLAPLSVAIPIGAEAAEAAEWCDMSRDACGNGGVLFLALPFSLPALMMVVTAVTLPVMIMFWDGAKNNALPLLPTVYVVLLAV